MVALQKVLFCPSVWIGAVSNDWTTSGNWRSPIGAPTTTSDVVIANDLSNYPTISTLSR